MIAHTPGPWKIDGNRIIADDPRQTIIVDGFGGSITNPEVLADARLIAAAPEMLEFVRAVAETFEHTDARLGTLARDLVARATGEA